VSGSLKPRLPYVPIRPAAHFLMIVSTVTLNRLKFW